MDQDTQKTILKPIHSNDEKFLIELVNIFQKRAILKAKNESFNQIIFNNFGNEKQKADKGQFFTPIPIVKTIIKFLNPIKGEELCDPCCGICDFLAMAFRHSYRNNEYPEAVSHFYGFDIEPSNLKLAELNLVLNGDGGAVLKTMDSIYQKLIEKDNSIIKDGDFTTKNYSISTWKNKNNDDLNPKQFDIIATNPPFGKGRDLKITSEIKNSIELYETYKAKKGKDAKELPNSMDMGVLFLENAYKSLKDGGRFGIILSNSIASIKEWENIRKWLFERVRIVALLDLPANTFGETGVSTSVIIAYKPKQDELHLLKENYQIFIKEIENIGYEVKTKDRTICFEPTYIINEETFEKTKDLKEDFTGTINDFVEFLKRQEMVIKKAFHWDEMKGKDKKSYGDI